MKLMQKKNSILTIRLSNYQHKECTILKVFLVTIATIVFQFHTSANEFVVKSFVLAQNDISAIQHKRLDVNDEVAAIVKVQTDLSGLFFDSNLNIVGDIEESPGEYLVYLSPGEKMLHIKKNGFIPLNYVIPQAIQSGKVYVLILTSKEPVTHNQDLSQKLAEFVIIDSKPQGASIYIDDKFLGFTPMEKPMNEGFYTVSLQLPNYYPYSQKIEVLANKQAKIFAELDPKFGHLEIESEPVSGASIILNGKTLDQKTPCIVEELPSGKYEVGLQKKFYEPAFADILIEEGKTEKINLLMNPAYGILNITTNEKTKIFLDDKYIATGKYLDTITPGLHLISLNQKNHYPETHQVFAANGKTEKLTFELKPITGTLSIVSNPSGANIYVDGLKVGKTPKFVRDLIIGIHQIKLEAADHAPSAFDVLIEENKITEINHSLKSGFKVKFAGTPSESEIYLNGDLAGKSPLTLNLKPAKYDITISKTAYISSKMKLSLTDADTTLNFSLTSVAYKKQQANRRKNRRQANFEDAIGVLFVMNSKNDQPYFFRFFYNYGKSHLGVLENNIVFSHDQLEQDGKRKYYYTSVWDSTYNTNVSLQKFGFGMRKILTLDMYYAHLKTSNTNAGGFGMSLGICTNIEDSRFDFYLNGDITRYFSSNWKPYEWGVTLGAKYMLGNAVNLEIGYVFSGWDLRNNDYVNSGETSAVVIQDSDNVPNELNQQNVSSSSNYFKFGISINFGEFENVASFIEGLKK